MTQSGPSGYLRNWSLVWTASTYSLTRLDMGCPQGDNSNNYSTNLTLRWPGFCGQGAGQTTLKFPFSGVTLHVHTEWLWKLEDGTAMFSVWQTCGGLAL